MTDLIDHSDKLRPPRWHIVVLWVGMFMFAFQAKKCSEPVLSFKFTCRVPKSMPWLQNEVKSSISFQHRDVRLKAVITAQDIDDLSPAIFIMLPWED